MELTQEVVLDPKLFQLLGATGLWQDKLLEQSGEARISDEVPLDRNLRDLTARISQNTLSNALETRHTDSVVAQVEELEARIRLQSRTQGSRAIDVEDVAIERQVL